MERRFVLGRDKHRRRGAALLLILSLLAITVAVSYALIRSQTQAVLLQNNARTAELARQAADAGLMQAIRKMHLDGEWGGVGSTLAGNFDSQSAYSVTFAAGDSTLTSSDPSYAEYPFRVTVTSTGTAWINGDINYPTTYTKTAVLQLVRRALDTSAVTIAWTGMNNYTVYQWNAPGEAYAVHIEPPLQIAGDCAFLGRLQLFKAYPSDAAARKSYLQDLLAKKTLLGTDYRPFTGSVALGQGRQDAATSGELSSWLGTANSTVVPTGGDPVSYPSVSTYRLFAGGPTYTIPILASDIAGTVGASVQENPLGIYKCSGNLQVRDGGTFRGTLLADDSAGELRLQGDSTLSGLNLPPLDGSSQVSQLPTVMARNNTVLRSGSAVTASGLFMSWNSFVFEADGGNTSLAFTGRLFTNHWSYTGPQNWTSLSSSNWASALSAFQAQALMPVLGIPYFPDWLKDSNYKLDPAPLYRFQPPSAVSYHWPNWSQPIYTKASGDAGLRWDIISWRDGP